MPNKSCNNCKSPFIRKSNAKFCSRVCMRKFNDRDNKKCKLCGKRYVGSKRRSVYCSARCSNRASGWVVAGRLIKEEIGKVCPGCKSILTHRTNRNAIFCSHTCAINVTRKYRNKSKAACHPDRPLVSKGLCQACWAKKYYNENKKEQLILARESRLRNNFGLTSKQWDMIFDLQRGLCPICDKPILKPNNSEGKRAAAVDHDHKTGRVRGLVHDRCNRFKIAGNTAESAKRLVTYLESEFDGRSL